MSSEDQFCTGKVLLASGGTSYSELALLSRISTSKPISHIFSLAEQHVAIIRTKLLKSCPLHLLNMLLKNFSPSFITLISMILIDTVDFFRAGMKSALELRFGYPGRNLDRTFSMITADRRKKTRKRRYFVEKKRRLTAFLGKLATNTGVSEKTSGGYRTFLPKLCPYQPFL